MKRKLQDLINALTESSSAATAVDKASQNLAVAKQRGDRAERAKVRALNALDFDQLDNSDPETQEMLRKLAYEGDRNAAIILDVAARANQRRVACKCPSCAQAREDQPAAVPPSMRN